MTPEELKQGKEWARRWKEAGPLLEQFVRDELTAMSEAKRLEAIDSLSRLAYQFREPRVTSGLVEQQRRFHLARC
jgi:hypothetical protein